MTRLDARLARALDLERSRALDRCPPPITNRRGPRYDLAEHPVIGFCGNDYLGLADRGFPNDAPAGASASRLVCGELEVHRELEQRVAALLDAPDAVLFSSGFALNTGALPALLAEHDRVYSDRLNHASLIDGLRLATPRPSILEHTRPPPTPRPSEPVSFWVTESVFSMDGDGPSDADLRAYVEAGGHLYFDEAHTFGLGPTGRGRAHALGLQPTLTVATLGKAIGCAGALAVGSQEVCRWLRAKARSFVYSTAPSPAQCVHALHQLERAFSDEGERARERLTANIRRFHHALDRPLPPLETPIIPFVVGTNADALAASTALVQRGFHVQAIRPPTVPDTTARLRVALSAAHDAADVAALAEAIREVLANPHEQPLASEVG